MGAAYKLAIVGKSGFDEDLSFYVGVKILGGGLELLELLLSLLRVVGEMRQKEFMLFLKLWFIYLH